MDSLHVYMKQCCYVDIEITFRSLFLYVFTENGEDGKEEGSEKTDVGHTQDGTITARSRAESLDSDMEEARSKHETDDGMIIQFYLFSLSKCCICIKCLRKDFVEMGLVIIFLFFNFNTSFRMKLIFTLQVKNLLQVV